MTVIKWNPDTNDLLTDALQNEKAAQTAAGAICVWTGACTGRSPNAKSLVEDEITSDSVDWSHNTKATLEEFTAAKLTILGHLRSKTQYKQKLFAGHDKNYRLKVVVTTEYAWQSLFAQNMFIKTTEEELLT